MHRTQTNRTGGDEPRLLEPRRPRNAKGRRSELFLLAAPGFPVLCVLDLLHNAVPLAGNTDCEESPEGYHLRGLGRVSGGCIQRQGCRALLRAERPDDMVPYAPDVPGRAKHAKLPLVNPKELPSGRPAEGTPGAALQIHRRGQPIIEILEGGDNAEPGDQSALPSDGPMGKP